MMGMGTNSGYIVSSTLWVENQPMSSESPDKDYLISRCSVSTGRGDGEKNESKLHRAMVEVN